MKYGSVNASGYLDACRLNVPYGDITLERATRLDLSVGHGDVRVGHVAGDAEIRLKSGSARLGHIDGTLRLDGANASVVIDSVGSAADLATSSGAVELGRAGGDVSVRSAYGVVRLAELSRGSARIEGSYGGVDIGVRRGTAVWLDAVSQHGVVRTDLAAAEGPADDGETLELHIRSGYGDITIHRSTLPPPAPTRLTSGDAPASQPQPVSFEERGACPQPSRPKRSPSATATRSCSTASTSTSPRVASSRCSDPTGRKDHDRPHPVHAAPAGRWDRAGRRSRRRP